MFKTSLKEKKQGNEKNGKIKQNISEEKQNNSMSDSKIIQVLEKIESFDEKSEKKSNDNMKFLQIEEKEPKLVEVSHQNQEFDKEKVKIINEILEKIDIFQSIEE